LNDHIREKCLAPEDAHPTSNAVIWSPGSSRWLRQSNGQLCAADFLKPDFGRWPGADVQSNRSTTVSELKLELVAPFAPGLRLPLKCLRIKEAALQV